MKISDLKCPEDMKPHLARVLAGEYESGVDFKEPPIVLDIGANVGAFALWALERWPGAKVHCYEPALATFEMLTDNVATKGCSLHQCAVGDPAMTKLIHGMNNIGEASLYQGGCRDLENLEDVETISPAQLPRAHVVKMDCEGAEALIVVGLQFRPVLFLLEYHSEFARRVIEAALSVEYMLVGGQVYAPQIGTAKYLRRDAVK